MRIKKQIFIYSLVIQSFINFAYSQDSITEKSPRQVSPSEDVHMARSNYPYHKVQEERPNFQKKSLSITKEELKGYPELVIQALIPALVANNAEGVAILLPIYEQQKNTDLQILTWGNAILAAQQQDYTRSLTLYRKLFLHNPRIIPIRYQMAQVLFLNNDNTAAKEQFEKLRTERLSTMFLDQINQYLTAINQMDEWSFQGGLSYLNDENINNAPKAGTMVGHWTAGKAESAEGIDYNASANKKWSLNNNFLGKISLLSYGKYYWNNKKYNEFNARISASLGYQTAHTEVTITPFTERRWYGGGRADSNSLKRFSQNSGLRLDMSYWLTPHWQLSTALEYGEQRYAKRKHLNGNNYLWSNTLLYMPTSNQFWFVGADYTRDNTRDKSDANDRKGIRVGWGQEWSSGISTRISLNYSKRSYKAQGFAQIQQKNKEYNGQITLWHRNLHIFGFTPRIIWSYNKVDSNNAFYSYDKNKISFEISKRF